MYSGLAPAQLADEPEDVFEALEQAAVRKSSLWTTERELLASILELLHMQYLAFAQAHGAKGVSKPLRVPRPGDKPAAPLSPREFAMELMRTS